ncbi:hypothetical protein P280DRAFT_473562 [Massarina eburnea CBS 473.64]|uniref:Nephrocystin 3-like N-terminal domain-containing protein n=1 Tax=Massarina eburnea CBS 473.64 TaxID=1395130 RepID=A0A6A6RLB9_9PLEO|nr:hypothetical protein P280DRAFT_473562 [Massarina eburnea CBS 473.64]
MCIVYFVSRPDTVDTRPSDIPRLEWAPLLSYIYADLMQLCLDLYHMFSRGASGFKLRHLRLSSLTPISLWRPLDSRLAQLEARLVHHKKWVQEEIACRSGYHARKALCRQEYIEFLEQQQVEAGRSDELLIEHRMAKRMRRIDKIKAWLSNNCAYRDVYEHRVRQRHPNTCTWFLDSEEYCKWKNVPFNQTLANDTIGFQQNWHDRVLFVQAMPGFGKSFLSGAVIDDLSAEAGNLDIDDEHEPPSTAFFHFNAAHSYCTHPNDAFRALTYQLIHTHRHDRQTLDAVSLLMQTTQSHAQASSDDVMAVLSLLMRQHATFFVIDGIDECSDATLFLFSLLEVCKRSDTRVILFSRPEINIPLEYQSWATDSPHIVNLAEDTNGEDIRIYLSENLNRMTDQGFFGISMDRSLLSRVANSSHGVFLWASLALKYLKSSGLSADERRATLERIDELEGLESLYQRILDMLNLRPYTEKQLAANLLRWLSLSINRMCVPGLYTAASATASQPTTDLNNISSYMESIPRLTCGLVEVTDCSIVFAHRSVKEYLQSSESQNSPFSLHDETKAHGDLAGRCLSFLAYEVPKRPLERLRPRIRPPPSSLAASSGMSMETSRSGDSGYRTMFSASDSEGLLTSTSTPALTPTSTILPNVPGFTPAFQADIPFLRYSSLCWPIHLTRALSNPSPSSPSPQTSPTSSKNLSWLPPLSAFLTDRSAVTTWVEASWRFNFPPNLSRLVPLLDTLRTHIPPATIQGRELRWVIHGIRELCEALNGLREEHGTTLRENPSLIWRWRGEGMGSGIGGGGLGIGGE